MHKNKGFLKYFRGCRVGKKIRGSSKADRFSKGVHDHRSMNSHTPCRASKPR